MAELSDMESGIESKQRSTRLLLGVIGVIVVGVGVLFFFQTRPEKPMMGPGDDTVVVSKTSRDKGKIKYKRLHTQMENEVTSQAIKELSLHGIAFDVERSGRFFNLSVDRRYYESAKNLLALKGIPSRGATGFELLDEDQGFGVTEYDKRIRYNRALAGELSKMIAQFYDIQDSQVRIVVPEKAGWQKEQPPVTASVLVRGVDGRKVSDKTVFSIMKLLQNSIENLAFENISVVDTYSNVLSMGIEDRLKNVNVSQSSDAEERKVSTMPAVSVKPKAPEQKPEAATGVNPMDSQAWLDARQALKTSMEQGRLEKMNKMLMGVLPDNTYQSTLAIEFSDVKNKQFNAVDIQRMTISIVVDSDQIPILEPVLKKKIFSVVSGAVAYVQGRDTIQLNLASLGLASVSELPASQTPVAAPESVTIGAWLIRYAWYLGGGLVVGLVLVGLVYRRRNRSQAVPETPLYPDNIADPIVSKVKGLARQNPESMASIITQWVQNDSEEVAV